MGNVIGGGDDKHGGGLLPEPGQEGAEDACRRAAIAGAAWASPDMTAAVVSFLTSPDALVLAAWGPAVRSLQAQDSQLVASMRALVPTAEGENRDLTEAEAATFAQHKAGRESLKARIEKQFGEAETRQPQPDAKLWALAAWISVAGAPEAECTPSAWRNWSTSRPLPQP